MRTTIIIFVLSTVLSSFALAAPSGKKGRFKIRGFYGMGFVDTADLNRHAKAQSGSSRLNSITSETLYGGGLGLRLGQRFELGVDYESQTASNPKNITSPTVTDAGWTLTQNEIWANLNFYLTPPGKRFYAYIGAGGGYALDSKAKFKHSATTEYTADKTIGYRGHAGLGVMLGNHFTIFLEGGYQSLVSGDLKAPNGTALTIQGTSTKAKMDLSGGRAIAGLALVF